MGCLFNRVAACRILRSGSGSCYFFFFDSTEHYRFRYFSDEEVRSGKNYITYRNITSEQKYTGANFERFLKFQHKRHLTVPTTQKNISLIKFNTFNFCTGSVWQYRRSWLNKYNVNKISGLHLIINAMSILMQYFILSTRCQY
jgi:hypothetical protein